MHLSKKETKTMSEEVVQFDIFKGAEFLKKYSQLRKTFRDASEGDKEATDVFAKFEVALKGFRKIMSTVKEEKDTRDVTQWVKQIQECEAFFNDDKEEIGRDKCLECDQIREIVTEDMCLQCSASYQARDWHDNFASRFDSSSESVQNELRLKFNAFVDAVEDMEQQFDETKYNNMREMAIFLHENLPILDADIDEDFDCEEDEESSSYEGKRKRDNSEEEDIYYKALKLIVPQKDYNYVMDNIENEDMLKSYAQNRRYIFQLKRVFHDFPDQNQILPGIYKNLSSARQAQKEDNFPDGKTMIVKINLF
jgi:hypothetical protein